MLKHICSQIIFCTLYIHFACTIMHYLNVCFIALSLIRYLYIIRPYFYQRVINIRVISGFVGATWVVGLVLTFLPQFVAKPYGDVPVCDVTQRQPVWYTFYICLVLYSSLCIVNFVLYSIILHAAGKQRKAVRANVPVSHQSGKSEGQNVYKYLCVCMCVCVLDIFSVI